MGAMKKKKTKIKQIAKDNPDLSYGVIRGILRGLKDVKNGKIKKYKWSRIKSAD